VPESCCPPASSGVGYSRLIGSGSAGLGNSWNGARALNRFNLDRRFDLTSVGLTFDGVTIGGFMGVEAMLEDAQAGTLEIKTNLVHASLPVAEIDFEDRAFDAGGLGRRIRAFRLPDVNPHRHVRLSRRIPLRRDEDNALYVRVTLEDGNVMWSSPIYLIVNDGSQGQLGANGR
jgi:hypothetical protein